MPKKIEGNVICHRNGKNFNSWEVSKLSDVKGYVNTSGI